MFYIKSEREGLFLGEFLGLGYFEAGSVSKNDKPMKFSTKKEAQHYLDTWLCGILDCEVVEVDPYSNLYIA